MRRRLARRLPGALVAVVVLLPLVVVPGGEQPFSTPKLIVLGGAVALGVAAAACLGQLRRPALPRGFGIAFLAWLAATGASSVFGEFVSPPVLWLALLGAAWFWLAVSVRLRAEQAALAMAAAGGIVSGVALLQYAGLDPFGLLGWTAPPGGNPRMRVFATLGNPNFVAAFLAGVLPLAPALSARLPRLRAPLVILTVLQAGAVLVTGSRATVLALVGVLLWLAVLRRLRWLYVVGAAALIVVLLVAHGPSRSLKETLAGRYYIWRVTATQVGLRPVFGFGLGGFSAKYTEWETAYWREGRAWAGQRRFAGLLDHAHNDYLEALVDKGLPGLLSFAGLLLSFLVFAYRHARGPDGGLVSAASAGVAALMAVALVDFPFHRPAESFVFWTLMAVGFLETSPKPRSGAPAAPPQLVSSHRNRRTYAHETS